MPELQVNPLWDVPEGFYNGDVHPAEIISQLDSSGSVMNLWVQTNLNSQKRLTKYFKFHFQYHQCLRYMILIFAVLNYISFHEWNDKKYLALTTWWFYVES